MECGKFGDWELVFYNWSVGVMWSEDDQKRGWRSRRLDFEGSISGSCRRGREEGID